MSTIGQTLRYYTDEYRRHPWLTAGALLMGPALVLETVISPLFIAKILGQLANHHQVSGSYVWLAASALLMGAVMRYFGDRVCSMRLTILTLNSLYTRCMQKFLAQEYNFFAENFAGSLVTQANRFVRGYILFVDTVFLDMFGLWCSVLVAIGIMTYYSPVIGGLVGILWLIAIGIVLLLVKKRIPLRRHAVAQESRITGELADVLTNAVTTKTFALESRELQRYQKSDDELSRRYYTSWGRATSNHFTIQILCGVLQLVVLIGGTNGVQNHTLSLALFLLFQVYILRIIDSVSKASIQMRQLEGIFGDATEMTEILARTEVVQDAPQPTVSQITRGSIVFDNVTFRYDAKHTKEQALFTDFNLEIKPGERVGLVGPSGGGKTTITRLILRFIDIRSGTIAIDGQDIRSIAQHDLHKAIGYVPQEPLLFHRSLLENIAYGDPAANQEAVITAAKQAHADDFIRDLPAGYKTLVGERGVKLSGGQPQRVAIARTLLKNAPILILDEATSALDSESEKYIQEALWELMEGKTTVVIAHRLSTIQHLDRIIVIDNGSIVEQGSHAQLLEQKGTYATLWAHQSGGFLEN